MDHAFITRAVHARIAIIIAALLAAIVSACTYFFLPVSQVIEAEGFIKGWGGPYELPREVSYAIAMALNAAVAVMMWQICKSYNLLRAMTRLDIALFLVMQLAIPILLVCVTSGQVLALVVLWSLGLMYSIAGSTHCDTRRLFLVFFLLSGCSTFDFVYAVYAPVFFLATIQLRSFSTRSLLAMIIGIVTPWIILFGFGIVNADMLQTPTKGFSYPDFSTDPLALLCGTTVFTAAIALGAWAQNVIKIMSYNATSRTRLSVITTMTMVTAIASLVDIAHIESYVTLLNVMASLQLAHMFAVIHNFSRSYIGVLGIAIIYILIYVCNVLIYI